jgi:hypothetical protein
VVVQQRFGRDPGRQPSDAPDFHPVVEDRQRDSRPTKGGAESAVGGWSRPTGPSRVSGLGFKEGSSALQNAPPKTHAGLRNVP